MCVWHIWAPPSSCLSPSLQSHSPPSPCQSPCQYPIRTQRRRQPSSSATTPAAPWLPPPPLSPPPSQTHASCRHSNQLCRGTPCRPGYHSDLRAQVREAGRHSWTALVKTVCVQLHSVSAAVWINHLWHFHRKISVKFQNSRLLIDPTRIFQLYPFAVLNAKWSGSLNNPPINSSWPVLRVWQQQRRFEINWRGKQTKTLPQKKIERKKTLECHPHSLIDRCSNSKMETMLKKMKKIRFPFKFMI